MGLADLADEVTVNLPYGRKRALEIATTLAMEPETDAGSTSPRRAWGHEDVDRVTQLIKKVRPRTILMVEHNMKVISTIADRITVLQRGAVLAEGPYEEVSRNPQVMEAYMGTTDGQLQGAHVMMRQPPVALRAFPLLLREGGRRQWPGQARSTASAGLACSAAFGAERPCRFQRRLAAICALDH